jgi:DNA-binding NtrC family response regulator
MLQSGGIKVFCANTKAQALEIFEAHSSRILLVLLDVVMPDSTPDQISAGLAKIRGDVQILLTSGFSHSTRWPAVDGRTIVGFLPKPYTRDQLLEAVATACPPIVRDLAEDSAAC